MNIPTVQKETTLNFLLILVILLCISFFFYNIIHLPIYNINNLLSPQDTTLQLVKYLSDSILKMFIGVIFLLVVIIIIIFRSNLRLNLNKDELQLDVGVHEKDITLGTDGLKKVVDEKGHINLYNSEVYRQLTNDFIISELGSDGKPVGFITMESYLKGMHEVCESEDCQSKGIAARDIEKTSVYAAYHSVQEGEDIFYVARKMLENKLSSLPVLGKDGIMKGSINYLQVLNKILEAEHTKNR